MTDVTADDLIAVDKYYKEHHFEVGGFFLVYKNISVYSYVFLFVFIN